MTLLLAPTFKTRKAFTLNALCRLYSARLPNCNDLPQVKGKALQLAAVSQVARMLIRLLKNDEMWERVTYSSNLLFIPTYHLFPQLPLQTVAYDKRPTQLNHVWGKDTPKIVRLLAKLPKHKVVFGLEAEDEQGDVDLLRALAAEPRLKHHTFLLQRPLALPDKMPKPVVSAKRRRRKSKVQTPSPTSVIQISYKQLKSYKRGKIPYIKAARKAGSLIIID